MREWSMRNIYDNPSNPHSHPFPAKLTTPILSYSILYPHRSQHRPTRNASKRRPGLWKTTRFGHESYKFKRWLSRGAIHSRATVAAEHARLNLRMSEGPGRFVSCSTGIAWCHLYMQKLDQQGMLWKAAWHLRLCTFWTWTMLLLSTISRSLEHQELWQV